ncbi:hypothetical protein EIN_184740 [Entamoeba invadens IP1]|uniref:hypothetical protein n=1 Tax=Entamoeba invadens IP1 TaxID=370355 RepID=UPI0002C3E9AC|nr:hypothetical protein EIN_184740 [Entamoeba invadens IP1]ELP94107.1 hypothetical protein EIN_184740 [Entamoeba invadens IP1]|eukprot:XP_004260878.1 hypothetical protein EIN_184740 [Entamoeba invadens IP1]
MAQLEVPFVANIFFYLSSVTDAAKLTFVCHRCRESALALRKNPLYPTTNTRLLLLRELRVFSKIQTVCFHDELTPEESDKFNLVCCTASAKVNLNKVREVMPSLSFSTKNIVPIDASVINFVFAPHHFDTSFDTTKKYFEDAAKCFCIKKLVVYIKPTNVLGGEGIPDNSKKIVLEKITEFLILFRDQNVSKVHCDVILKTPFLSEEKFSILHSFNVSVMYTGKDLDEEVLKLSEKKLLYIENKERSVYYKIITSPLLQPFCEKYYIQKLVLFKLPSNLTEVNFSELTTLTQLKIVESTQEIGATFPVTLNSLSFGSPLTVLNAKQLTHLTALTAPKIVHIPSLKEFTFAPNAISKTFPSLEQFRLQSLTLNSFDLSYLDLEPYLFITSVNFKSGIYREVVLPLLLERLKVDIFCSNIPHFLNIENLKLKSVIILPQLMDEYYPRFKLNKEHLVEQNIPDGLLQIEGCVLV